VTAPRIRLVQSASWSASVDKGADPYASNRCCVCHRLVLDWFSQKLTVTRTNDGEWWVVARDAPVLEDERQLGAPHFTLPIGNECLRQHPEYRFAIAADARQGAEGA